MQKCSLKKAFIYQYINQTDLETLLESLNKITGLHAQFIDENGDCILSSDDLPAYCRFFSKESRHGQTCKDDHIRAAIHASGLGNVYCHPCHGGLYHLIYSFVIKDTNLGSILIGPFLMHEPDADIVSDITGISEDRCFSKLSTKKLINYLGDIAVKTPEMVNHISNLIYYCVNNLITGSKEELSLKQNRLLQQSQINEAIRLYKSSGYRDENVYPIELENLLLTKVRSGDTETAKSALNELLGALFLNYGTNITEMKTRLIELASLLSRVTIEHGADAYRVLSMNTQLIDQISTSKDFFEMCHIFQENINIFTESLYYSSANTNKTIRQATEYMALNFSDAISLTDMADFLHLNSSYLSILFKKVTGFTFKEYLNHIRIEEAKRLLSDSDFSIIDIASACGFNDQGYFSKVFKKHTGLSPKQYR